jgi:hypothetical protein
MNLFAVYRTPYKPLPQWQCELFAALILPPMIMAMIVWQLCKRMKGSS